MKVLLTGANGFVGQHLQSKLEVDFQLLKLREITDIKIEDDVDAVIHLGAKVHDLNRKGNVESYYKANFELTKALFNAFSISNARKFIFFSSVKAAADKVPYLLKEDVHPQPMTDYGKSKLLAEKFITNFILPKQKSAIILRPCLIHGLGNRGNFDLLCRSLLKGLPYPLSAFENKRSFLSIDNLCFTVNQILQRENFPSGVYNIADDEPLSTNNVIEIIESTSGKKISNWKINRSFVKLVARMGDHLHLPFNSHRLEKLTDSYVVDNSKIKNALGKELPITARQGMVKTVLSLTKS